MRYFFYILVYGLMSAGTVLSSLYGQTPDSTRQQQNTPPKKSKLFSDSSVNEMKNWIYDPAYQYKYRHVFKLNFTQLLNANLSAQYEFTFHKNLSLALGGSYLTPRQIGGFLNTFSTKDINGMQFGFVAPTLKAWAITPELRWYPGKKEKIKAPNGFYLAPYFRVARYALESSFTDTYNGVTSVFGFNASLKCVSGGGMVGAQWLFGKKKNIAFDWWIIGLGFGRMTPYMEAYASDVNMSPAQQQELKDEIEQALTGFRLFGFKDPVITVTNNSFSISMPKIPYVTPRGMGFCLGYSF
ncbi:MAG: DUF3575 domain-containing protein [Sediminibacterium sp.]|nr:DUF3575 domain-containing protein [Sediminibacterium sp.]